MLRPATEQNLAHDFVLAQLKARLKVASQAAAKGAARHDDYKREIEDALGALREYNTAPRTSLAEPPRKRKKQS